MRPLTTRQWSLVILMILINYLIFSQLFSRILDTNGSTVLTTRTPEVTFTPTPTLIIPVFVQPTSTAASAPGTPTATNTRVIFVSDEQAKAATATVSAEQTRQVQAAEQTRQAQPPVSPSDDEPPPTATPTPPPTDATPSVTSNGPVNLRTGPGTNYARSGALQAGQTLEIIGRTADSAWWQVATAGGPLWVAASVTSASNVSDSIPVVAAPPPPTSPPARRRRQTPRIQGWPAAAAPHRTVARPAPMPAPPWGRAA